MGAIFVFLGGIRGSLGTLWGHFGGILGRFGGQSSNIDLTRCSGGFSAWRIRISGSRGPPGDRPGGGPPAGVTGDVRVFEKAGRLRYDPWVPQGRVKQPRCTQGVPKVYPRCTQRVPTVYPRTHPCKELYRMEWFTTSLSQMREGAGALGGIWGPWGHLGAPPRGR